jgi:hypothetical protein
VKKSTLTVAVMAILVSASAMATAVSSWTPSGSVTATAGSKNLNPCLTSVSYDEPYGAIDLWLNLPAGFALQTSEEFGLGESNLDNDGGDKFNLAIWKKFIPVPGTYLNFRVKYINGHPVMTANGADMLAYDVFVGKSFNWDGPNTIVVELRAEYWHFIRDANNGMISIMPSVAHEYKVSAKVTVFEKIGLQWNNELAPFGELLSGMANVGAKVKVSKNLTWKVLSVTGMMPLQEADANDPRKDLKEIAAVSELSISF